MQTDEDIVTFLASKPEIFRIGSCEVEDMIEHADDDKWNDDARRAVEYYDNHSLMDNGSAWYLEEKDGNGVWRVIGFGTAGKSFAQQCAEIVGQLLNKTYILTCSNGYRDWSRIPKASSSQELIVKLTAAGW